MTAAMHEGKLTEYADLAQGSDEWLEARRGIITASVVGQLVTSTLKVANNDTSRGLTRLLVAERITGRIVETYTSDAMWRGRFDEPLARELYGKTYEPVSELGFMVREFNGCRLGYSADGLVGDDGLIEVKSAEPKIHLRRILDDAAPSEHMAQCQAGLMVSGRKWLDFLSYCGGMPMWRKRVFPDHTWFDAIATALTEFEVNAADMTEHYTRAVEGLPETEYIEHFPEAGI